MKKTKNLNIKLLVLDVDGVLTDGKIYLCDDGTETKTFHVRDGIGIKLLLENKVEVALISGRKSKATAKRARDLGIKYSYLGVKDKLSIFNKLKDKLKVKKENIACVGDDIPDTQIMQESGLKVAVADANPAILKLANHVTKNKGGEAAVREICDMILKAKTKAI